MAWLGKKLNQKRLWQSRIKSLREAGLFLGFSVLAIMLVLFILGFIAYAFQAEAATGINQQLNYQGKLTDENGVAVADDTYNIKLAIYDASSGGNCLWTAVGSCADDNIATTTMATVNGIFSVTLGGSSHNSLATSTIDWNSDSLYLGVTIRGTAATPVYDAEMTPRKQLTAAPYAFNANLLDGYNATTTAAASSTIPVFDKNLTLNLFSGGVSSTFATTTQLFVRGNATTTGSYYIGQTLSVATTSPYAGMALAVTGSGIFDGSLAIDDNLSVIGNANITGYVTTTNLYSSGVLHIGQTSVFDGLVSGTGFGTSVDTLTDTNIGTNWRGQANGLASLGADSKILNSQLSALAISDTFVVASKAEMLALSSAEIGDVAIRTDEDKSYILADTYYSVLANWKELLTPTNGVISINGQTGVVTLSSDDISEGLTNLYFTNLRVTEIINARRGVANGLASLGSEGKIPTSQLPDITINNTYVVADQTERLALSANVGDIAVQVDTSKSYILAEIPASDNDNWIEILSTAAVTSVNGYIGDVDLTTSDITEGSNLYWTNDRFDQRLVATTTWSGDLWMRNGNLGVGINPSYPFEVVGIASTTDDLYVGHNLYVGNSSAADSDFIYFDAGTQSFVWNETMSRFELSNDFYVDGTGNATITNHFEADEFFYIKDNKVGIGTDSPGQTLDVIGNASSSLAVYAGTNMYVGQASAADDDYLYFDAGGQSLMWDNDPGAFVFSTDTLITGGLAVGSAGIAANTTDGLLQVCSGACAAATIATAAGELYVEGDIEADGNGNIAGTFTVLGNTSLGDSSSADTLTVTADGLFVGGFAIGSSGVTANSTDGLVQICSGACSAAGVATAAGELYVEGDIEAGGNLNIGGTFTLGSGSGALSASSGVVSVGTLAVGNGGTGATSFTANGVLYGNTASAIQVTTAGTSGQLFLGVTSGAPKFATMSGNASITNAGVVTVSDLTCTDCIGTTEIADSYVLNTSDTMSGSLSVGTTLGVGTSLTIGIGAAGVDYVLTFDGESNDGTITWMEDETYFQFGTANNILMSLGSKVYFRATDSYIGSSSAGVLMLDAATQIDLGTNLLVENRAGFAGAALHATTKYAITLPNNVNTGYGIAVAWDPYSDSRTKTEQRTLNYGLAEILKLQPKRYVQHSSEFIDGQLVLGEGGENIGLIAQEVYGIIPEAANKPDDESTGLWSLSYDRLVPVIIKALQELSAKVDAILALLQKNGIELNGELADYQPGSAAAQTSIGGVDSGTVMIPDGATSTEVIFREPFISTPKIIANVTGAGQDPNDYQYAKWLIADKSTTGFRIVINEPEKVKMVFDWIALGSKEPNTSQPPVIGDFVTSLNTVGLNIPVELWLQASDPDTPSDKLSYSWKFSPNIGTLEGDSGLVYWKVPDGITKNTDVTVTATVSDGKNSVSQSKVITVLAGNDSGVVAGDEYEEEEEMVVLGCIDQEAINYNSEATEDDQSCEYEEEKPIVLGCTDQTALNYNPEATEDDGSCEYEEEEEEIVLGCMDETALNYNNQATEDDGSCEYEEVEKTTQ